jgi:DNA polymerase phi
MFPVEKPKKSKKVHKPIVEVLDVVDSDEPPPIDILIDVLIGFLETSTAYMRAVANQVFAMLTSAVQVSTLDLIAAVSLESVVIPRAILLHHFS